MTRRTIGMAIGGFLLLAAPAMAAESPAELISSFRVKQGEVRVVRDATLDRIALEQARAMAAKDQISHDVLGPFTGGTGGTLGAKYLARTIDQKFFPALWAVRANFYGTGS